MTFVESISFPDITLKLRLDKYLRESGKKKSPCVNEAVKEYLEKRGK